MRKSMRMSGVALVLALAACADGNVGGPDLAQTDTELAALLSSESGSSAAERGAGSSLFDRLAAEIPGFGGLYRDGPCFVKVVLTDMSQAGHAIQTVRAALEPLVQRSCPQGVHVAPVQGDFTYIELQRYRTAARPLLQIRGVTGLTISYPLNRLVVHVAARTVVPTVLEALDRLDIPEAAVVFQGRTGGGRD